jgi:hypothetical protein
MKAVGGDMEVKNRRVGCVWALCDWSEWRGSLGAHESNSQPLEPPHGTEESRKATQLYSLQNILLTVSLALASAVFFGMQKSVKHCFKPQ